MVRPSAVDRVICASLLVMLGSSSTPMFSTCQPLNTSSTTAAIRGRARCCRHHFRLWTYLSWTFSNQGSSLGSAFFSTVEAAAGTTVTATMRDAMRQ